MTAPAPREGRRRALHVATGALGLTIAKAPPLGAAVLAALVVFAAILELMRFRSRRARAAIASVAGGLFRSNEALTPSGATLLIVGYLLTWLAFPPLIAGPAITVAAVADPAAGLVGRRLGGGRGPGKTLAGSAAAFAAALLVLLAWRIAPPAAAVAALAAALVERVPLPGADNVAIPLATAAVLRLA